MVELAGLEQALGVSLGDRSRLEQALVHGSYINEIPAPGIISNDRLEYLGDAVLGLVVAEELYQHVPRLDEGVMTRLRSSLVSRDSLARVAATVGLGRYLYLGKGEEANGGRNNPKNMAACLEAVIAAVYLDRGLATARDLILRLLGPEIARLTCYGAGFEDYKSQLQEYAQAKWQLTPTYHLVEAVGPAHQPTFTVEVRVGDAVMARGTGTSKKAAETEAARRLLQQVFTQ